MKIQVIVACDRVLESPDSGPSIIATFQKLTAKMPADQVLPRDAVVPRDWAVFSVWALDESENNKPYVQHFEFYWPDGKLFVKSELFSAPDKADSFLTFTGRANGFPIGLAGKLKIRIWVEHEKVIVSSIEDTWVNVIHQLQQEEKA